MITFGFRQAGTFKYPSQLTGLSPEEIQAGNFAWDDLALNHMISASKSPPRYWH